MVSWWLVGLSAYLDQMRKEETKEEDEVYTPYEHLRTVIEESDFYALEYKVDVNRDILGKQ